MKVTLRATNNKCRCGKPAEAIKEETWDGKQLISTRIVASNCPYCDLQYVDDDLRGELTPAFQKTIRKISL